MGTTSLIVTDFPGNEALRISYRIRHVRHFDVTMDTFVCFASQVPAQFVDAILAIHTKFSELITTTLGSDLAFTIALDKVGCVNVRHYIEQYLCCKISLHYT